MIATRNHQSKTTIYNMKTTDLITPKLLIVVHSVLEMSTLNTNPELLMFCEFKKRRRQLASLPHCSIMDTGNHIHVLNTVNLLSFTTTNVRDQTFSRLVLL